jgi:translation initiation factor 3 subunit L
MYQDTFEDDDLIAEVELVTQESFTQNMDMDDSFDAEGRYMNDELMPSPLLTLPPLLVNLPGSTPQPSAIQLPDGVRNFIMYFYRNVLENNVYELHNVYDSSFNKLTNKYYQKQPWPEAELIAPLVNDGKARRIEAG